MAYKTIYVSEDTHKKLSHVALSRGISIGDAVKLLVDTTLEISKEVDNLDKALDSQLANLQNKE